MKKYERIDVYFTNKNDQEAHLMSYEVDGKKGLERYKRSILDTLSTHLDILLGRRPDRRYDPPRDRGKNRNTISF